MAVGHSRRNDDVVAGAVVARRVASELVAQPYPDAHAEAVAELAYRVARELGASAEMLRTVVIGGLVHDIGKLAIDAAVLEKPTQLDESEWRVIQRHPHEGARLLGGVFADEIVAVVRWHHERLDGSGYPDALPGGAIPFPVRLVAVADAFRAMQEDRPYRPPVPTSQVVSEFERGSGTQWDPDCVDALLSVVSADAA